MSDAIVRLEALNPGRSFIVEAPAGSGKTELLVKRYLKLLDTVQRPEEILAITFTRKAAHEMRERVLAAGKVADEKALQIMTIDSFCRLIVGQAPLKSPVLTASMLEDEVPLRNSFLNTLLDVIEKQEEGAADLCTLFQYFDNQLLMVCDLLFDLLKSREEWLPIVLQAKHHGDPLGLQAMCIEKLYEAAWKEWQSLEPSAYRENFGDESNLQAIAARILTQKDEVRKAIKEPVPPAYVDFFIKVKRLPERGGCAAEGSLLPVLLKVLPLAAAYLQVLLQSHQWTDFHDIALAAVNLLETEPEMMQRLDHRIKHILVDEFQDTSNLQFRLLQALTADWLPDDGRTIFLVGDPKQSIYGFRHANVGLFLQARDHGIGAIRLHSLVLQRNFRSDPQIINFINRAGAGMFPVQMDPVLGKVQFMPSEAQREFDTAPGVQQHFFATENQEAEALALQIKVLQQNKPGEKIAILVRARSHFAVIIPALQEAGIVYQVKEDRHWLDHVLVDDLMNLLYSMHHRGHRLAWMALLRSPFCGLVKADLLVIAQLANEQTIWQVLQSQPEALSPDGHRRVAHLVAVLHPILEGERQHAPVYLKWLDAWRSIQGQYIVQSLQEARIVEIFQRFVCLCKTLPAYMDFKRQLAAFDPGEIDGHPSGVLLLTIHQSKGLEFDHVFLPALNRQLSRGDSPILLSQLFYFDQQFYFLLAERAGAVHDASSAYEYLKWLNTQRSEQEILRLLYVAMTRAKQSLWLSAVIELDVKNEWKQPAKSFLKYLCGVLDLDANYYPAVPIQLEFDAPVSAGEGLAKLQGLRRLKPTFLQQWSGPSETCLASSQPLDVAGSEERALGQAMHRYLEYRARYPQHLIQVDISLQELTRKIEGSQIVQWLLSPHQEAQSEWPLVSVNERGEMVKHIIDRSFIDEGVRYIIDYKLTQPGEAELLPDFLARMAQSYRPQLQCYKNLVCQLDQTHPIRLALYFPLIDHLEFIADY
jgi:ATP-dependent helicase/nuclease subunit A